MLAATFGGAAEPELVALELDHRHRRFGRDTVDPSVDEVIQHHVADDEDGSSGDPVEQRSGSGHRQAACGEWRTAGELAVRRPRHRAA